MLRSAGESVASCVLSTALYVCVCVCVCVCRAGTRCC